MRENTDSESKIRCFDLCKTILHQCPLMGRCCYCLTILLDDCLTVAGGGVVVAIIVNAMWCCCCWRCSCRCIAVICGHNDSWNCWRRWLIWLLLTLLFRIIEIIRSVTTTYWTRSIWLKQQQYKISRILWKFLWKNINNWKC